MHTHTSTYVIIPSLRGTEIFPQLLPALARHLLSTRKLRACIFVRDCDKRLEIVAVLFDRGRSVIVVTIGSEVESVLKVGHGRLLGGSGAEQYRSEECVPAVRSASGMPDWLGQGHYLPTCPPERRRRISSYVHALTCTGIGTCLLARTWKRDRVCRESRDGERERERERAGEIASRGGFFRDPKSRHVNFSRS